MASFSCRAVAWHTELEARGAHAPTQMNGNPEVTALDRNKPLLISTINVFG